MPSTRRFADEVSPTFHAHVERWIASGSPVSEPRTAATVLLVRDGARGPEVFMQRRASTMAFAPDMVVFPGGRVDPADAGAEIDPSALARTAADMGLARAKARPIIAAAIREVGEECGVRLDPAGLRPRARWITPEVEPRRYDTWFFAAAMPDGQEARGESSETVRDFWDDARSLLAAGERGTLRLMPPTIVMLEQLAEHASVGAFLAEPGRLDVVQPHLVHTPDGYVLESVIP